MTKRRIRGFDRTILITIAVGVLSLLLLSSVIHPRLEKALLDEVVHHLQGSSQMLAKNVSRPIARGSYQEAWFQLASGYDDEAFLAFRILDVNKESIVPDESSDKAIEAFLLKQALVKPHANSESLVLVDRDLGQLLVRTPVKAGTGTCVDFLYDIGASFNLVRTSSFIIALVFIVAAVTIIATIVFLRFRVQSASRHLERGIVTIINSTESVLASESTIPEVNQPLLSEYFLGEGLLDRVRHELATARQKLDAVSRDVAIARTTQMLAHDVRKPFSSLEMGLSLIKNAKSPQEMRDMVDLTAEAVQKALVTVNGLINDVMEIGRTNAPITKPVVMESLMETAIFELFQVYEEANINLEFRLKHPENFALSIEEFKVLRVFANILGNAVQALKRAGTLLIATRDATVDGQAFIEITLGNSGPPIPDDALPQLFEAFYTSNKEGGTGLGLAIAKKVVMAHGGRIWCESPGQFMPVEFHFTLPAITDAPVRAPRPTLPLPATSGEVYARLKPKSSGPDSSPVDKLIDDPRETRFEREIVATATMRCRPLRVAVVDDELIYRDAVIRLLGDDNKALRRAVVITAFSTATEALADSLLQTSDVVICDVDLGAESCSGFEVIRALRRQDYAGTVCVHSNRCLPEDFKRAMDAGADTVFPKPMGRAHLLQILATTAKNIEERRIIEAARIAHDFPYRFAVIEDDSLVRSVWQSKFGDRVALYASATELLGDGTVMEQVRDALISFDFIVTDFYLEDKSPIPDGIMVASIVQRFYPIPVFLCSSAECDEATFGKLFAGRFTKFDDLRVALVDVVREAGLTPR